MRKAAWISALAIALSAAGCGGSRGDDDEDLGTLSPGESEEVEINVFAAEPVFLEECKEAEITDIEGPTGDAFAYIDAEITDAVSRTARGECETDVTVTVRADAPEGHYQVIVRFTYETVGHDDDEHESGEIDFDVDD